MAALEEQNDADISNRLRRIEGQIRGIIRMLDEQRHCDDVITQVLAARSAMDACNRARRSRQASPPFGAHLASYGLSGLVALWRVVGQSVYSPARIAPRYASSRRSCSFEHQAAGSGVIWPTHQLLRHWKQTKLSVERWTTRGWPHRGHWRRSSMRTPSVREAVEELHEPSDVSRCGSDAQ